MLCNEFGGRGCGGRIIVDPVIRMRVGQVRSEFQLFGFRAHPASVVTTRYSSPITPFLGPSTSDDVTYHQKSQNHKNLSKQFEISTATIKINSFIIIP